LGLIGKNLTSKIYHKGKQSGYKEAPALSGRPPFSSPRPDFLARKGSATSTWAARPAGSKKPGTCPWLDTYGGE